MRAPCVGSCACRHTTTILQLRGLRSERERWCRQEATEAAAAVRAATLAAKSAERAQQLAQREGEKAARRAAEAEGKLRSANDDRAKVCQRAVSTLSE